MTRSPRAPEPFRLPAERETEASVVALAGAGFFQARRERSPSGPMTSMRMVRSVSLLWWKAFRISKRSPPANISPENVRTSPRHPGDVPM